MIAVFTLRKEAEKLAKLVGGEVIELVVKPTLEDWVKQ